MGSNVSMPAAPAAPTPIDPAKSSLDYINAMADPELQGRILASEQMYRPKYAALNLADINTYLMGGNGQQGVLDLTDEATRRANTLASQQLSAQRAADIGDVEALGSRASAAFLNANPALKAQLDRATALGSNQQFTPIGRGQLGDQMYQDALGASGLGQVGQNLNSRAATLAQSTGALNPDELRQLEQSTRAAYAARGRSMDNSAIGAEGLSRLTNERQRMQEDLALSAQLNQMNQAELNANRQFQQGVQQSDISRQTNNQQILSQLLGQDRAYALQLAQAQQGVASDPFQAILGRPSQSQQAGMASTQFASGLAGQNMGPMLFDPNAGINLGLQQNANLANYNSNIYGAQASYAGATNQGRGAMIGGIFSGLGALGGGALAACWVARECYGADNPRWLMFRWWLLNSSPSWFRNLYLKHGERFAAFIKNKPLTKWIIRKWMDSRIGV